MTFDQWPDSLGSSTEPQETHGLMEDRTCLKVTNLPHIARNRYVNQAKAREEMTVYRWYWKVRDKTQSVSYLSRSVGQLPKK